MGLVEHAPGFGLADVNRLALELFSLRAVASELPSERDQNFLLATGAGERFVLKIANALERRELLEAENAAMRHVAATGLCPRPVTSPAGDEILEIEAATGRHYVRLLTWLPGVPMGTVRRHSDALLESLGRAVATIDRALLGFDHPALHRDFYWDLAQAPDIVAQYRPLIGETEVGDLVDRISDRYERDTRPLLGKLRQSVIHNDANDYNVLVGGDGDLYSRNQSVTGIVDFGDAVHSHTINGLAIAVAYAVLKKPDPLEAAARVVAGYHSVQPVTEEELAVLFELISMRMAVSAAIAAHQTVQRPGDPYLSISQQSVRETLPKLAAIHPRFANCVFREACGLAPVPTVAAVVRWLEQQESGGPLLGEKAGGACSVDLSVGSPLISSNPAENGPRHIGQRLNQRIPGGLIGVGGYLEARAPMPDSPPLDSLREPATLHLGVDLTCEAGTPVLAPLPGTVEAAGRADLGPSVLLRHETGAGETFFTFYGRLSRDAATALRPGQRVNPGDRIGEVGTASENGGRWPHLHFQIVTDRLDQALDFPSLARASQRSLWSGLCPDPNLVLRIATPPATAPRSTGEILARRRRCIGGNLSISYRNHLQIVRGWMQHLYDENGRAYLDAYNNVAHVGHSHPRVVRAAREQLGILNTNTRYLQRQLVEYAESLASHFPAPLGVCFFVNSGSEANELAIRLARARTGQRNTIVLEAAYHGHTTTCIDLSPYKHDGPGGAGRPPWVHQVALPDTYRGAYRSDTPDAGAKYAGEIGETIERLRQRGEGLCAYLAETCPSVGGQIFLPDGYLTEVYRLVREAGGVTIADEVQTGFGRLGTHFWGFEAHGVVPDIVVLGKPIGNGYPLGAVVTTPEIARAFDNGMEFFSTFGGSTGSCAVGKAVLDTVVEERLQDHALRVGERLLSGLRERIAGYPLVGDIRGSGLFVGVELVRDRQTLEPATEEAAFIANRFRDHGILLGTDGPHHNVIKIRGPMPFSESDADLLVDVFVKILEEDFASSDRPGWSV